MMITTHVTTAVRQLLANKGKAALTMLGVIIGIGSVIYMMTMGEIAKQFLLSQISQFGTNVIEAAPNGQFGVFSGQKTVTLTDDDITLLDESSLLPEIKNLATIQVGGGSTEYNGETYGLALYGIGPSFAEVNHLNILYGRFVNDSDLRAGSRSIVIDDQFAKKLFIAPHDALSKMITIDGNTFTIVGIIESLPQVGPFDSQTMTYIPQSTLRHLFMPADEQHEVQAILIEFEPGTNATNFEDRIKYELNRIKDIQSTDEEAFTVVSRQQFLQIFDSVLLGIQLFVSAIAAISLVVGGIGIMNIMLVTVKERTKEIGLRKAVGAKNRSILTQFLIEAIILTTVGGLIGAAGGIGLSALSVAAVNLVQPDWGLAFIFVPSALIIACSVSITIGIIFGLYPAWKASRLHPIESLRYE